MVEIIYKMSKPYKKDDQLARKSKKEAKDQESIQSSTTPDPGYHVGKWQTHN